jgi:hypothetical protein
MELTWINKLRIVAVAALGIVVIGLLAWPLAAPADPLSPVRAWSVSPFGTMTLLILAFGLGFTGYFIAWPHGREIGILAVPFGLTIWAGRSGPMRVLTQACKEPYEREALAFSLRFEPLFWLLIVAAGFAGVLLAQHLRRVPSEEEGKKLQTREAGASRASDPLRFFSSNLRSCLLSGLLALVATVLLAHFFVGVFAQDVATSRNVTPAQPPVGQIIFAVIFAFAIAAFLIKKFTNLSYIWPAIGSVFITGFAQAIYCNSATIRQFAETRPATFFPHSALTILPVQYVALGTLGSVLGYWMAVRYDWWRKHESGL